MRLSEFMEPQITLAGRGDHRCILDKFVLPQAGTQLLAAPAANLGWCVTQFEVSTNFDCWFMVHDGAGPDVTYAARFARAYQTEVIDWIEINPDEAIQITTEQNWGAGFVMEVRFWYFSKQPASVMTTDNR